MQSAEEFKDRSQAIARCFLQTAVIVDDEAFIPQGNDGPASDIITPDRHAHRPANNSVDRKRGPHTLDAGLLVDSFSALGVICGVVSPTDAAMTTMRRADIVILDWRLQRNEPDKSKLALEFLRDLLTGETDQNSLRLVAIYTGEPQLEDIRATVFEQLENLQLIPHDNGTQPEISYRHGRVVFYAKPGVNLPPNLQGRSVSETDFPKRLVDDFASMTSGLLPGIALTSLTAVRENAHKVLDRFSARLDPAFLTHRTCLPRPDDAEQQIVGHLAEELRGLMDNAVAAKAPAGAKAVEDWIRCKDEGSARFTLNTHQLSLEEAVTLAREGLEKTFDSKILSNRERREAHQHLTACFGNPDQCAVDLDRQLAWIMSFRTVHDAPPPTLWLGTVVAGSCTDNDQYLVCMRPRCDCVRLEKETTFLFLPLVEPKKRMDQIVVRIDGGFQKLGIARDPCGWVLRQFDPRAENGPLIAARQSDDSFEFEDTEGRQYTWIGELKPEYAQRIAQTFGAELSRVAINESEWLRRGKKH